jgi:hypothetical protein
LGDQIKKNERVGHVAHERDRRDEYRVLVARPEGRRPLGRCVHSLARIILKCIFKKGDGGRWIGLMWIRAGTSCVTCECTNEISGSINVGNFLTS